MNDKLIPALRQFRHNDSEGFVNGYDMRIVDREFAFAEARADKLRDALAHAEAVYRLNVVKDGEPSSTLENMQRALEDAAEVCDRFAGRDMSPAECASAIRAMKSSMAGSAKGGITNDKPAEAAIGGPVQDAESAAKAIYKLFDLSDIHPWVEGGNSLMQGEARRYARAALAAKTALAPEGLKLVPIERSYDERVKQIIAFNQCGGDLDDQLEAAHKVLPLKSAVAQEGASPAVEQATSCTAPRHECMGQCPACQAGSGAGREP